MSAAATTVGNRAKTRRRVARHPIAVPVDITIFRTSRPTIIPGRAVDLGEAGISAVLAGEVDPGDAVGVEFCLPGQATPLNIKALVRHQSRLQCGVEFLGLTPQQQIMLRNWAAGRPGAALVQMPETVSAPPRFEILPVRAVRITVRRRLLWMVFVALLIVGGLGWWQWHRAWSELESHVPATKTSFANLRTTVTSDVMEQLAIHKVDPVYPAEARRANLQGVVVLNAVIGSDGKVVNLHPVSGPGLLTPAAMDAVKWWRFQPYRVNGKPTEVETTISLEFRTD